MLKYSHSVTGLKVITVSQSSPIKSVSCKLEWNQCNLIIFNIESGGVLSTPWSSLKIIQLLSYSFDLPAFLPIKVGFTSLTVSGSAPAFRAALPVSRNLTMAFFTYPWPCPTFISFPKFGYLGCWWSPFSCDANWINSSWNCVRGALSSDGECRRDHGGLGSTTANDRRICQPPELVKRIKQNQKQCFSKSLECSKPCLNLTSLTFPQAGPEPWPNPTHKWGCRISDTNYMELYWGACS